MPSGVAGQADRIAVLRRGSLAACGAPAEVFTEQLFRDVFDIEVLIRPHPERQQPLVIRR